MRSKTQLDSEELCAAVHAALSNWHQLGESDDEFLAVLLLVQEERKQTEDWDNPLNRRRVINEVLGRAIDKLEEQDEKAAFVLRARFEEEQITRQVAARLHASPDQVNRWQRAAIESLCQILYSEERKLRDARYEELLRGLPLAPYLQLFGMEEIREEIGEQVLREGEPYVIAIAGMGGIGKTSLADAIVRRIIPTLVFEQVIWLEAATDSMNTGATVASEVWERLLVALSEQIGVGGEASSPVARSEQVALRLREKPSLVIIDNLEKELHTQYVLREVRKLVNPSKFLLTTRARPTVSAPAFFRSVEELSLDDAAGLLRHHAQAIGSQALAAADETDYQDIFNVTGGNPLALKLVAGLAAVLPLPQIIEGLANNRPGPIEDMYRHIYWEAWRSLGAPAQQLLQAMPLVSVSGALPEHMTAMSGLDEDQLWAAITELFARSLLETRGTVRERRYSIHRLTETFLRTEIIHWPEEEALQ